MNILLTLAYDGTAYNGWQRQSNGMTVQQKLEEALGKIYGREMSVVGASRTDAGVHALGQRAMYKADDDGVYIPPERVPYALRAFLPADIVVRRAEEVCESFHPIYSAKAKTYEYNIFNGEFIDPVLRNYFYRVPYALDINKMAEAARHFVGKHDFKTFCASGSAVKTTAREIYSFDISADGCKINFKLRGDGFLYNMVRIIAGTVIAVGENKINPDDIPGIIGSRDRANAGKTAPPHGLRLLEVVY